MAVLVINGYAGRREIPVDVVKLTPARADVVLKADARIPRKGVRGAGEIIRVPRSALSMDEGSDAEIASGDRDLPTPS